MRRFLATFLSCSLASLAVCADAPVLAEITIPDGARLTQHFQASVFGRMWKDPALAALRPKVDTWLAMLEAELGFPPLTLPESLTAAQATFFGFAGKPTPEEVTAWKKSPDFRVQIGLGALAEQVFAKLKGSGEVLVVPGATEAVTMPGGEVSLARIGDLLVLGSAKRLSAVAIAPEAHDISFRFAGDTLAETIALASTADKLAQTQAGLAAVRRYLVPMSGHLDFTPTHVASYVQAQTTLPFLTTVDLRLCARLPATAYAVNTIGVDGAVLWDDIILPLLKLVADEQKKSVDDLLHEPDQHLAALGATTTLKELITSVRGTLMLAQTPGAPIPGYTLAVPRSPALDQVLGLALKQIGNDLPAEGESAPLTFPNLPLPITLVRDRSHWVISSDTALATTWTTTADDGWLASPLGKLASEQGKDALMLAVSDTAAELRSMQGYLGLGLGSMPLEPKEKQAVMRAFSQLIANAGLSHEIIHQRGDLLVSEGQSMLGGSSTSIALVAIIAAVAIPNLLESRVAANEAAAATSLKAGVFPAQVQFQGGGYRDRDSDNIGEFGFFSELSGGPITGRVDDIKLNLMPGEQWDSSQPAVNGYCFAMYLPDGMGGAFGADDDLPKGIAEAANAGEQRFICYAWPVDSSSGHRIFALTQAGIVYSLSTADGVDLDGEPPAWNLLFGGEGKGWQDAPAWEPHRK